MVWLQALGLHFCIGWQARRREKSHWKRSKSTSKQNRSSIITRWEIGGWNGWYAPNAVFVMYCNSCFTLRSFTHAESSKLIWHLTSHVAFLQATFHQMLWQWRLHHSRSKWPFEAPHHSLLAPHGWVGELTRLAPACGRFPAFLAQRKVQRSGKPPAEAALGIIKAPLRSAYPQKFQLSHAE